MKKIIYLLSSTIMFFALMGVVNPRVYSEEKSVSVPLSFSYASTYWWRGVELDGKGVGVLWPGAGLVYKDFSLNVAAGISQDWISLEDNAGAGEGKDYAKSLTEVDYGVSYTKKIDNITIGTGLLFANYPYYDEENGEAINPSYFEASLSVGLSAFISPALTFYYDYYVKSNKDADGDKLPKAEDYYVKFSLSKDLIATGDGFAFSLLGYIGYYNNAYLDRKGFSDAVLRAGISKSYKDTTFSGGFNYGRTLGKDFKDANGGIKNHFWADFGASITL